MRRRLYYFASQLTKQQFSGLRGHCGMNIEASLPEVGAEVSSGSAIGELESTKSVSDIYAPVSGEVVARNDALDATPELVNNDPYGGGWLFEVVPADPSQLDDLLEAAEYEASLEG